jgi:hypothetical protein
MAAAGMRDWELKRLVHSIMVGPDTLLIAFDEHPVRA